MKAADQAKYVIEHCVHMTIATADTSGKPWISPVFFMYDDAYNFYWVSNKDATHSKNVRNRPEVAIVITGQIPDGNIEGVYIDATAMELRSEDEITTGIAVLAKRKQSTKFTTTSTADVTGETCWRMYKATPKAIYKRADATKDGQAITTRQLIHL